MAIKLVERSTYRMTEAIKKLLDDDNITGSNYQSPQAWKLRPEEPGEGFGGAAWRTLVWYQVGIDEIRKILTA